MVKFVIVEDSVGNVNLQKAFPFVCETTRLIAFREAERWAACLCFGPDFWKDLSSWDKARKMGWRVIEYYDGYVSEAREVPYDI